MKTSEVENYRPRCLEVKSLAEKQRKGRDSTRSRADTVRNVAKMRKFWDRNPISRPSCARMLFYQWVINLRSYAMEDFCPAVQTDIDTCRHPFVGPDQFKLKMLAWLRVSPHNPAVT